MVGLPHRYIFMGNIFKKFHLKIEDEIEPTPKN